MALVACGGIVPRSLLCMVVVDIVPDMPKCGCPQHQRQRFMDLLLHWVVGKKLKDYDHIEVNEASLILPSIPLDIVMIKA